MEKLTIGGLDRAQYLLERMLDLAEASADDRCTDKRRAEVLEIFEETREEDKQT